MVAPTHTLQSCAKHCSSVTGLSEAIDEAFNVANHQILMGSAESPFNILLRSDGGIALSNKRVDVTELELHSHDEPMLLKGQDSESGEDFNSDEDEENQKLFDPEEALARVQASFFINGIITHSDRIMKPQEVDHYAKTLQLPLQSFGYNFIYSILSQMHVIHQVMQSHEEYTVSHMDDLCPDASLRKHTIAIMHWVCSMNNKLVNKVAEFYLFKAGIFMPVYMFKYIVHHAQAEAKDSQAYSHIQMHQEVHASTYTTMIPFCDIAAFPADGMVHCDANPYTRIMTKVWFAKRTLIDLIQLLNEIGFGDDIGWVSEYKRNRDLRNAYQKGF
ncbi:hypothetical protein VKT23_020088 [Stygiomarasmius scandens]|uniref:Uncharacterized protein n=1 Tax=Marasmiellus scandens TaxID=2682957 RepID=A0ABR1IJW0_9AGAR